MIQKNYNFFLGGIIKIIMVKPIAVKNFPVRFYISEYIGQDSKKQELMNSLISKHKDHTCSTKKDAEEICARNLNDLLGLPSIPFSDLDATKQMITEKNPDRADLDAIKPMLQDMTNYVSSLYINQRILDSDYSTPFNYQKSITNGSGYHISWWVKFFVDAYQGEQPFLHLNAIYDNLVKKKTVDLQKVKENKSLMTQIMDLIYLITQGYFIGSKKSTKLLLRIYNELLIYNQEQGINENPLIRKMTKVAQSQAKAQSISSLAPPSSSPLSSPPIGLQQQMKAKAQAKAQKAQTLASPIGLTKIPAGSQQQKAQVELTKTKAQQSRQAQAKAQQSRQAQAKALAPAPAGPQVELMKTKAQQSRQAQVKAKVKAQVDRIYGQLSEKDTPTTWSVLPINDKLKSDANYRQFFIDAINKKYEEIELEGNPILPLLILGYYKIPALRDDINFQNFMIQLIMQKINEPEFYGGYTKYHRAPEMEDLMMMRYITRECVQPLSETDSKKVKQCKRSYCKYWPGFKWLCRIFPTTKSLSQKYDWARKFIEQQKGRDDNWAANFLMAP